MTTGYLDNFYARLGVEFNASQETIRSAYFQAAKRLHPDTNDDSKATELFLQIQEAYENLSVPDKRSAYDSTLPKDIDQPTEILINPLYSRLTLPQLGEKQLVYILLDLMALPQELENSNEKAHTAPLNISLVIDKSTSMAGKRMDIVKTSAIQLLRRLKPVDTLSIVTFNDRADVIIPAKRGLDYHELESRISLLQTGGGTEMYQGLKAGFQEVKNHLSSSALNHIILITDGQTYGDEEECIRLAEQSQKKGITISALGIGSDWNDEFVDTLTSKTGGSSMYAAKAKDIEAFFTDKFDRISTTYADQVVMHLTTGKNVDLRYAFRLSPDPGPLNSDNDLNLGYIPIDTSLTIVMEFAVDAIPTDVDELVLADGSLKMEIPSRSIPSVTSRFEFSRPVSSQPDLEPPPQALIKAMSRLSLYRLQEQARREIDSGEVEKATTRLQNLATQLLMSGEPDLAHTVMLELNQFETGNLYSAEAQKKIKYGTRALILPISELE